MNFAVLDLETNGFKGRSVVSASSLVFDENGRIRDFFNRYYLPTEKPDQGAINVHGLTPSRINHLRMGASYPLFFADDCDSLDIFWKHYDISGIVVHNLEFDTSFLPANIKKSWKWWCSMKGLTDFCRIPGKRGKYKWPRLEEAKRVTAKAFHGTQEVVRAEKSISEQLCHNSLSDCFDLYSVFTRIWSNRKELVQFNVVKDNFVMASWNPRSSVLNCEPDEHVRSNLKYSLEIARIAGLKKREKEILQIMKDLFPFS